MNTKNIRSRIACALLATASLIGAVAVPNTAQADRWDRRHGYYGNRHHHDHGGTAAAIAGVGILGVLAAGAAANSSRDRECWIERRRVVDYNGYVRVRRIQVCE